MSLLLREEGTKREPETVSSPFTPGEGGITGTFPNVTHRWPPSLSIAVLKARDPPVDAKVR